jgi:hypothetical protein
MPIKKGDIFGHFGTLALRVAGRGQFGIAMSGIDGERAEMPDAMEWQLKWLPVSSRLEFNHAF